MWSTLKRREDSLIDPSLEVPLVLPEEDQSGPGTSQSLVCRGGDNVRVVKGISRFLREDKAGDVSHIHHQEGAILVRNLAEGLVVPLAGVRTPSHDKALRLEESGIAAERHKINVALRVALVGERLEVDRGSRDSLAGSLLLVKRVKSVSKVATRGKVKTHDTVCSLKVAKKNK